MLNAWRGLACLMLISLLQLTAPAIGLAGDDDDKPPVGEVEHNPKAEIFMQPADDLAEYLSDHNGLNPQEEMKTEALTHYLLSQTYLNRGKNEEAYRELIKANQADPKSLFLYRELIPLAMNLNHLDKAFDLIKKATELNPDDYRLLQELAHHSLRNNRIKEALDYFEKAVKSKELDKKSQAYVVLNKELGQLYLLTNHDEKAAECMVVVFEALAQPEQFKLDNRVSRILNNNPQETYEDMGQLFLATGKYEMAQKCYEKLAKLDPRHKEVLGFNMARLLLKQEKVAEAETELQRYFTAHLTNKGIAPYALLSEILNKQNKGDQLISELEKLKEADPKNHEIMNYLAEQYVNKDRFEEAQALLEKSQSIRKSPEVQIAFVKLYRKQGKAEELLKAFARALEDQSETDRLEIELELLGQDKALSEKVLKTGRENATKSISSVNFLQAFLLGKLAIQQKQVDDAIYFYDIAITKQPQPGDNLAKELIVYLMLEKKYEEVDKRIQQLLDNPELTEHHPAYYFLLSESKRAQKKIDEAIEQIHEARKIDPENAGWVMQEGLILAYSKRWSEAANVFRSVIKDFAEDTDSVKQAKMNLSNALVQAGQIDEGEQILEHIYEQDKENIGVNNDLGYLYADHNKKLEQAHTMIEKALHAEPDNGAYLDSMGWVLYRQGKYTEALDYIQKAVDKRNGGDAVIYDHLADCFKAVKQEDKAYEYWKKALEDEEGNDFPDLKMIDSIKKKLESVPVPPAAKEKAETPLKSGTDPVTNQ
jgi:tetratricopeptide (TPR) repeat protein